MNEMNSSNFLKAARALKQNFFTEENMKYIE
jgi:hypothetical protein